MKNKIYSYLLQGVLIIFATAGLSSCLTGNLEDVPAFEEAEIVNVKFDFRYKDATAVWIDGQPTVKVAGLIVQSKEINSANGTITVSLSIPGPSGSFTQDVRRQINISNIVGKFNISTGASIVPLNDSPVLGIPGDFSVSRRYEVKAADGKTSKVWTITVNPLPELSQYEGLYIETGTLDRVGNPTDQLNAEVYLGTVDVSTVWTQAAKSVFNNPAITYRIKVNPDNSVTITDNPGASVVIYQLTDQPSFYDPATKTFTLHYAYNAGARIFHTQLKLKE